MFDAHLEYWDNAEEKITSFCELKKQLEAIKEKSTGIYTSPVSADVVIEDVGRICIGLDDPSIITYISADLERQMSVVGDRSATGEATFYCGDYSLMSGKYLLPYTLALDVVEHFLESGKLSDEVEWTYEVFKSA